jgi:two-component system, NarL family, nitrate/nitrite response regulator NarL
LDDGEAPLLTPRETEVLAAIAEGLSNKAAARRLGISQHTVKFHVEPRAASERVRRRDPAVYLHFRGNLESLSAAAR